MNKIKQFLRNASVRFHMFFIFMCMLLIFCAAWIYVNVNQILCYILLTVSVILVIIDSYYAIHKTAKNYLIKYERACFNEVKKFLTTEYSQIFVFSSSSLDKSLSYYGKINKDNTIAVYGKNKYGKEEFNNSQKDCVWFMENFYVM